MTSPLEVHPARRTVFIDWGGTLMRVFPFAGPMMTWPEVAVCEGVERALAEIKGSFILAVATNAADSDGTMVRQALKRGGIEDYFDFVLTARDLEAAKPDTVFYKRALRQVGCQPRNAVMVGDSYDDDIIGAKRAGLRTVWYNSTSKPCPDYARAYCDAVIRRFSQLPGVLAELWPDKSVAREQ